jgi:hypothetical protein
MSTPEPDREHQDERLYRIAYELATKPLRSPEDAVTCPSCGGLAERVIVTSPLKWGEWPAVEVEHHVVKCSGDCGSFYEPGGYDAGTFRALQILLRDHAVPSSPEDVRGADVVEARERSGWERRAEIVHVVAFMQRSWLDYILPEIGKHVRECDQTADLGEAACSCMTYVREILEAAIERGAHRAMDLVSPDARSPEPAAEPDEALEIAWGIIANAYGGNWDLATEEWREAAIRWRDEHWHPRLPTSEPSAEPATGRDRSQDVTEQELASAGGEPRYTLDEVAEALCEAEAIYRASVVDSLWDIFASRLRSGGATTETGENDG